MNKTVVQTDSVAAAAIAVVLLNLWTVVVILITFDGWSAMDDEEPEVWDDRTKVVYGCCIVGGRWPARVESVLGWCDRENAKVGGGRAWCDRGTGKLGGGRG